MSPEAQGAQDIKEPPRGVEPRGRRCHVGAPAGLGVRQPELAIDAKEAADATFEYSKAPETGPLLFETRWIRKKLAGVTRGNPRAVAPAAC